MTLSTRGFGRAALMSRTALGLSLFVAACGGGRTSPSAPTSALAAPVQTFGTVAVAASCRFDGQASCFATTSLRPSSAPGGPAAAAPAAPSGLTATASGSTVTLTWTAPGGGDAATGYIIEAGSAPGLANLAAVPTSSATTFSASGVGSGTYYVRVRATNASGTSAASNEAVLVVGGSACTAPGAPSGLAATVSGTTVVLSWTAAFGSPTSYIVEAGSGSGLANLVNSDLGSAATTLTATGVGAGTYYVRMRAKNACGTSGASNEVVVAVGTTTAASFTGTWTGQWTTYDEKSSPACGKDLNNVTFSLTQSDSSISGTMTWTITQSFFPSDVGKTNTAPVTGTVSGSSATLSLGGRYTGSATISANTLSGSFTNSACQPMTFSATKQ